MLDSALPRPARPAQRRVPHPSMPAQVIAVNAMLISAAVLAAAVAAQLDLQVGDEQRRFYVLIAAILATVLVNAPRRAPPLRAARAADRHDGAGRRRRAARHGPRCRPAQTEEVTRLYRAFDGMLDRLEDERSRTAGAVLRAQEDERARIARDLHDEANQALTGVVLRLQATAQDAPPELREELRETREAATQAMEELLRLARELRPAALDDHGLAAALRTQGRGLRPRRPRSTPTSTIEPGALDELSSEQQVVVYRIVQESLSNVATHADARSGARERHPRAGRHRRPHRGRRAAASRPAPSPTTRTGCSGCASAPPWPAARCSVSSRPGTGTVIELRLEENIA